MRSDTVWQNQALVDQFLTGVRGAIPFARDQITLALRLLDHTGIPVERVADLGCGDGTIAQAILNHYPTAQVTALDFSTPMLEQAARRLQPYGDRVRLVQADLYMPDWCTTLEPCDAILSGYCIHHLPDDRKQALYREIYALLKPGGCFLNLEHVQSATPWVESLFNEVLTDSIYAWHQAQSGTLSRSEVAQRFVYREDKAANILAPVEAQCDWLRSIGFQQVDCYFKVLELAVFGGLKP
jgi:ubiquinone/menaquinone biosynthesis C-methylase UbiE